jgi:hypothetical protein
MYIPSLPSTLINLVGSETAMASSPSTLALLPEPRLSVFLAPPRIVPEELLAGGEYGENECILESMSSCSSFASSNSFNSLTSRSSVLTRSSKLSV